MEIRFVMLMLLVEDVCCDFFEESFQPQIGNPPELNQFLTSVLEHKNEFNFVRDAAKRFQKFKKAARYTRDPFDTDMEFYDRNKRHASAYNVHKQLSKKIKSNLKKKHTKNSARLRREMPESIFVEPEGEKGDLVEEAEERPKHKKEVRSAEQPGVHHRGFKKQKYIKNRPDSFYMDADSEIAQEDLGHYDGERYNSKAAGYKDHKHLEPSPENDDFGYVDYELPTQSKSLSDRINFERAPSFELEPHNENDYVDSINDPQGNSLLSVDEGRPDSIQPLYPPRATPNHDHQPEPYEVPKQENEQEEYSRNQDLQEPLEAQPVTPKSLAYVPNVPINAELVQPEAYQQKNLITREPSYIPRATVGNLQPQLVYVPTLYTPQPIAPQINFQSQLTGQPLYGYPSGANLLQPLAIVQNNPGVMEAESYPANRPNIRESLFHHPLKPKPKHHPPKQIVHIASKTSSEGTPAPVPVVDSRKVKMKKKGKGFIAIAKNRRENNEGGILSKHSLHPLRLRKGVEEAEEDIEDNYRSRKLQAYYEEEETEADPSAGKRRDLFEVLGMKNEDDYGEDNSYKDTLKSNNTDVHNDTAREQFKATNKTWDMHDNSSTYPSLIEDLNTITQVLHDPEEVTGVSTVGEAFKKEKDKDKLSDMRNTEDNEKRPRRNVNSDIQEKILKNKNRIYSFSKAELMKHKKKKRKLSNSEEETQLEKTNPNGRSNFISQDGDNSGSMTASDSEENSSKQEKEATFTTQSEELEPFLNSNISSPYEKMAAKMDIENEKLAQLISGHLASNIVCMVYDQLKGRADLKSKIYSGLSRKHVNYESAIDYDIFKGNNSEDLGDARHLLTQLTKVLNRLVMDLVRRKLCQRLPDELRDYLGSLLEAKAMLAIAQFVPNTHQGDFLFSYQDKGAEGLDVQRLQESLVAMENLLLKYQSLSENCQNKAKPVKEYIEKHVQLLRPMVACHAEKQCNKNQDVKRAVPLHRVFPSGSKNIIEEQLESVGLGKNQMFIPRFDLSKLVRSKMKKHHKRDVQNNGKTLKYRKLEIAAAKMRAKREYDRKIGEMFGKKKRSVDYEEPVVYSLG